MPVQEQPALKSKDSFRRSHCLILIAIQCTAILLIGAQNIPETAHYRTGDLWIYFQDSGQLLRGNMPYRDFALEYPPLALAAFSIPRLLCGRSQSFHNYLWAFLIQSALISTIMAFWVRRLAEKTRFGLPPDLALIAYCCLVIVTSFYLPWRYDLFPALLTALAFGALLRGRPLIAGV